MALSWSALFVLSLLLQYMAFATAPVALAVHDDGLFELDGNAVSSGAVPGDDWDKVHAHTSAASDEAFIHDPVNDQADDTFKGNTGDDMAISDWRWVTAKASQAKNDIADVFAAAYTNANNHMIAYFGLDKWEADGDNFVGFWFFKGQVGPAGDGSTASGDPFSGSHQVGDILVLADYTNGGGVATFNVYKWVGSGGDIGPAHTLQTVASGVPCTGAPLVDEACAVTNTDTETAPWAFDGRDGAPGEFPAGTFFEGGIDLTALGLDTGCFTSFIGETRSSQSVTATLSDFAGGKFSFCEPPTIATQVRQDGQSLGSVGPINLGESVTDHATLTGSKGTVTGKVDFFVCFNASATPSCATGGDKVGASETLSGGQADSDAFTPDAVGFYCFRVNYTAAEGSKYLDASHTNRTSECFQVLPANVTIAKTADVGPFSAGDQIGFTLSWGNSGAGKATGVVVTDNLPAGGDLDWSIAGSTGTGSTCSISGAVGAEVLTCNVGSINGNTATSGTVHVVSGTTAADCATVNNKGSIASGNDGSGDANASLVVSCPDIRVQKTAAAGQIRVGDTASFTITVSNIGTGIARNVALNDPLPGGLAWTIDPAVSGCSITSGILTCDLGDMDPTESVSITVTADTEGLAVEGGGCTNLPNTASAAADNEGTGTVLLNNQASADIDVCESVLTILKSVTDVNDQASVNDPDLGVPGAEIDDVVTFTLHYTGGGLLENAFIVDVLPVGEDYVAGTASSNADFAFTSATLGSGQWTLRWDATGTLPDPAGGDLTYDVKVLAAAAEQPQPLTNTATIDSDQTNPDSDTAAIAVAPPPEALTPPPTDVFTPATGTSSPGFALMLVLLAVAGVTIAIGFVTPVPARARRSDR
jgi:uncharacterized repeat protein (TIGR01451 family)